MALYDGNQLPENVTSNFQLLVSIVYTLMMSFFMSLGAFAAWATSRQLTRSPDAQQAADGTIQPAVGQYKHPTEYMSDLVQKRNAIVRGLLAFIPAVFSLAHLYTSSLHSSTIYGTGQVFYAALLAFSALYMGKTLQQLVIDSDRMDTTKAVYESLYMLAAAFDRLRLHPCNQPGHIDEGIFKGVQDALPKSDGKRGTTPAWRSPWILLNCFLAIGAQDDVRIWPMFSAWLGRFQLTNFLAYVPCGDSLLAEFCNFFWRPAWLKACEPKPACPADAKHTRNNTTDQAQDAHCNVGYAYWLFSQDKSVRTITGSMVIKQGVADEMLLAGCRTNNLYYTAEGYWSALSAHVKHCLDDNPAVGIGSVNLVFISRNNKSFMFNRLAAILRRVFHTKQALGLSMICERYICRRTPAFAALCLPTVTLVPRLLECLRTLHDASSRADGEAEAVGELDAMLANDPGYWCRLWLAYMHMVLVGVDLLRMHNNKPYFKDTPHQAGFLQLLAPEGDSEDSTGSSPAVHVAPSQQVATATSAAAEEERIVFMVLHDLSDADLYNMAACVATLLLRFRMLQEGVLTSGTVLVAVKEVLLSHKVSFADELMKAGRRPSLYDDFLQQRSELVRSHSSLPAIVEGVECVSAAGWVDQAMSPLRLWVMLVGITAAVTSTIACSKGVFLVVICGAVQSLAAWSILLYTDRLPKRPSEGGAIPAVLDRSTVSYIIPQLAYYMCVLCKWFAEVMLRPVWLLAQALFMLWLPDWLSWCIRLHFAPGVGWLKGHVSSLPWKSGAQSAVRSFPVLGLLSAAMEGVANVRRPSEKLLAAGDGSSTAMDPADKAERGHVPSKSAFTGIDDPPCGADLAAEASAALAAAVAVVATAQRAIDVAREAKVPINMSVLDMDPMSHADDDPWLYLRKQFAGMIVPRKPMAGSNPSEAACGPRGSSLDCAISAAAQGEQACRISSGSSTTPMLERPCSTGSASGSSGGSLHAAQAQAGPEALHSASTTCDPLSCSDSMFDAVKSLEDRAIRESARRASASASAAAASSVASSMILVAASLQQIRWQATRLFLGLRRRRISLLSCFEPECRRFYRERIKPWNVAIKLITPMFFYIFLIFIALAVCQENWYVHEGMCLGRCLNGSDCWADQNLGMPWADNSLGHWLHPKELTARGIPKGPPVCPGTGTIAMKQDDCQQCAWMESTFRITVLRPAFFELSHNTTLCQAEVLVVNMSASNNSLPPSIGTPIPAMWQSMYGGENQDNSSQVGEKAVSVTNDTGYAVFLSPTSKPFNSSSGYGCNITVLEANITGFSVHPSSQLSNSTTWGCIDCKGDWFPTAPCDAMCESQGSARYTYHITQHNNTCGKPCPLEEGQNTTFHCVNATVCKCTGAWLESKACDAPCQSPGSRTMTYHITKPAMDRWVDGKLVPGEDCEAKDMQTKDEPCFNYAACTVSMHADVYSKSGPAMHADLVPTGHVQPVP